MEKGKPGRSGTRFGRTDWLIFGGIAFFLWVFLIHPDIMETSNHSYILLDGIFHGKFGSFYETVRAHENELYYINNAHYNVFIYLLFALWQLPVYLLGLIFSFPMNETFYFIWSKGLSVLAFLLSARMLRRLAAELGAGESESHTAMFAYLLNPVSCFISVIMGQYDTFCLFFMLAALIFYVRGDILRFSALMGLAALGKFFAVFLLIPLLLLKEKRPFRILKYGAAAALPLLLTALIFRGSDSSQFLRSMTDRLFENGIGNLSLFLTVFAALSVWCFLKKESEQKPDFAVLVPLFTFGALFLAVLFHPQWISLFIPFWVLAVFLQKNKQLYLLLGAVFSAGFFLYAFFYYPEHFELNLFGFGLLRLLGNTSAAVFPFRPVSEFLYMYPLVNNLCRYLFPAALCSVLFARIPFRRGVPLADAGEYRNPERLRFSLWLLFLSGTGFWAAALAFSRIVS